MLDSYHKTLGVRPIPMAPISDDLVQPCPIGGEGPAVLTADLCYCETCDHLYQIDLKVTQSYDQHYVASRYDVYPTTVPLAYLRAGLALTFMQNCEHANILDVGYGNGAFLKAMGQNGYTTYGTDIHGADYGVHEVAYDDGRIYDLITFFDSLEHLPNFCNLKKLRARTLIVSYPYRPIWFPGRLDWKHYRPGEHLHYFSLKSLDSLFGNFNRVWSGYFEDHIRGKLPSGEPNILTAVYQTATGEPETLCRK